MPTIKMLVLLFLFSISLDIPMDAQKIKGKSIEDGKVYLLYTSDHEAPEMIKGLRQFEYEAVYTLRLSNQTKIIFEKGLRQSEIGYKRSPVWNKVGNKIAYLSFVGDKHINNKIGNINIKNLSTGETKTISDLNACGCGLTWDESGNTLAFGEKNFSISIYDLKEGKKRVVFESKSRPEGISISPNGKHIVFKTRDGSHSNDEDGWRLNLLTIGENKIVKIGLLDDKFGVLRDFRWKGDSSKVVFKGFLLDEDGNRLNNYWTYDVKSQEMNPFFGSLKRFQMQSVRFWKSNKFY